MTRVLACVSGLVLTVAGVVALCAGAGPPAYPDRVVHVPAAEHEETIRTGRIAARRTNELIPRDLDLGIRVSMGRKLATPPVAEAEVHADFGHIFLIEEGGGTLLLGGELVNPTQRGQMWVAASITGGEAVRTEDRRHDHGTGGHAAPVGRDSEERLLPRDSHLPGQIPAEAVIGWRRDRGAAE